MLEPLRAFKPPVAKQFSIKRSGQHRGPSAFLAMMLKRVRGDASKVRGVFTCARLGRGGIVRLFQAKIDFGTADPPVAMPSGPVLFMEFQIVGVTGITLIAAPHLNAGTRIAGEKRD